MKAPNRPGVAPGSTQTITLADLRAAAATLQVPSPTLSPLPAQIDALRSEEAPHRPERRAAGGLELRVSAAHSGAGATTVALAIAEQASLARPTRLIDAADPAWTGLRDVQMRETHVDGAWCCADRGDLRIERLRDPAMTSASVPDPLPPMSPDTLTVVDVGWSLRELRAAPGCWLHGIPELAVIVTRAAAGAHPAERALQHLGASSLERVHVVTLGSRHEIRRLHADAGPLLLDRYDSDAVTRFPLLANPPTASGRTGASPRALTLAARHLLDQIPAHAAPPSTSEHVHQLIAEGTPR